MSEMFQARIQTEILDFINSRQSLQLATAGKDGLPYASYSPFATDNGQVFVLLSEIAIHASNLLENPHASLLIIQDEDSAEELFARVRVNYQATATHIEFEAPDWKQGINCLAERHGERIHNLAKLADFKLFKLQPTGGRFVKGFGKAFDIVGNGLSGYEIKHLRGGHTKRTSPETDTPSSKATSAA
ncbi:MAG: HugZ family protein [Pontibacterium sp.]